MPRFFGRAVTATTTTLSTASTYTDTEMQWKSTLPSALLAFSLVESVAYFVYVGYRPAGSVIDYFETFRIAAGSGAQNNLEVGAFTSTLGPSGLGTYSLAPAATTTNLVIFGSPAWLTNATPFGATLVSAAHCYAGIRSVNAGNEPTFPGLVLDMKNGWILTAAAAPALTATNLFFASTVSAVPSPVFGNGIAPDIRLRRTL